MSKCLANVNRLRGYKIKIYPTEEQKSKINCVVDTFRAVYNLAIEIQEKNYQSGGSYIKYHQMCKIFSDMRNDNLEYSWLNNIQISTIREALRNVDWAYQNFFDKRSNHPKFKSKKKSKKFFNIRSERTHSLSSSIRIPEIGLVDAKKNRIPVDARLYNTGVVFDGYDYWFYCQIEKPIIECEKTDNVIGIDVGIRNMITTSDEEYFRFSDVDKLNKRLKRQQRRLSKHYKKYLEESMRTRTKYEDIPKSKNMEKLLQKQHKTIRKIVNKRMNDIHNATKNIVDKLPSTIVIEDIKRTPQLKNGWSKKYVNNMMYYEIHRQLKYKSQDRGIDILVADEEYPSSQLCSKCGARRKIYGSKVFICHECGNRMDRDYNAALNLRSLAI